MNNIKHVRVQYAYYLNLMVDFVIEEHSHSKYRKSYHGEGFAVEEFFHLVKGLAARLSHGPHSRATNQFLLQFKAISK